MDRADRVTLVFFGGTGDLAVRKLMPAVFDLWREGALEECLIVGIGRSVADTAAYRAMLAERVAPAAADPEAWGRFVESVEFHRGELGTAVDFVALRQRVVALERERGLPGNRLFYFAVAPEWFGPITRRLSQAGLLPRQETTPESGWSRIVVEKPFGHDRESAIALDEGLRRVVDERQIYRIDHYLGKETVQNLIAFRFANGLIEPTWNRRYIDHVQITVAESVGIEGRAGYYEQSGALRDMMQNHMLQLLALTAMEPPISLEADAIRDEKVKALRSIRLPETVGRVAELTVRGQYGPGKIDGRPVPAYREEPGVPPDSTTPTFVAAKLYLESWRWAGVPFLLRHGKRLPKRATEIAIQFRTPPLALFRGTGVEGRCVNLLVLRIQPDEGISLHFGAKVPGGGMEIRNVEMDFSYEESFQARIPDAYERLLLDAMTGEATLFTRSDEVRAMWRWADAILAGWRELGSSECCHYAAGTWGPPEANKLFGPDSGAPAACCLLGWRRL